MPKPPPRPYWESNCTPSPIHRRVFISKIDSCPQATSTAAEAAQISRTSTGNASFTAASITRKELPYFQQHGREEIGRSVENIFNRTTQMSLMNHQKATIYHESRSHTPEILQRNKLKGPMQNTLSEPFGGPLESTKQQKEANMVNQKRVNSVQQRHHKNYGDSIKRSSSVRRCVTAISNRLNFSTKFSVEDDNQTNSNKIG